MPDDLGGYPIPPEAAEVLFACFEAGVMVQLTSPLRVWNGSNWEEASFVREGGKLKLLPPVTPDVIAGG